MAAAYYQIDGATWTEGTCLTISAPADHSNDGLHTVSYYSTDNAGNTETAQSCTVKIDTTPPVISLAYLSLSYHQHPSGWATHRSSAVRGYQTGWISWSRHGSRLSLSYRIDDNWSPTVDVTVELMAHRGKVLQTVSLGQRPTGKLLSYRLPGKLPHGHLTACSSRPPIWPAICRASWPAKARLCTISTVACGSPHWRCAL